MKIVKQCRYFGSFSSTPIYLYTVKYYKHPFFLQRKNERKEGVYAADITL
jgi:hypothetical protein